MPWINTNIVDDIEIVVGFNEPYIDSQATKRITNELLRDTEEYKDISLLENNLDEVRNQISIAFKLLEIAKNEKVKDLKPFIKDFNLLSEKSKSIRNEIVENRKLLSRKYDEIYNENIVRFNSKGYEQVEDSIYDSFFGLFIALLPDEILTREGNVIIDNRGKQIAYKDGDRWEIVTVESLSTVLPDSAKLLDELTDQEKDDIVSQIKKDETVKISQEELEDRKKNDIYGILIEAGNLKSGLELEGDPDAAKKAKAWLDERKNEIEERYAT